MCLYLAAVPDVVDARHCRGGVDNVRDCRQVDIMLVPPSFSLSASPFTPLRSPKSRTLLLSGFLLSSIHALVCGVIHCTEVRWSVALHVSNGVLCIAWASAGDISRKRRNEKEGCTANKSANDQSGSKTTCLQSSYMDRWIQSVDQMLNLLRGPDWRGKGALSCGTSRSPPSR